MCFFPFPAFRMDLWHVTSATMPVLKRNLEILKPIHYSL